jgi:putative cell wall-binding protein
MCAKTRKISRIAAARRRGAAMGLALIFAVLTTSLVALTSPEPAAAADIRDWDPGYIISDENFYDGNAMTEAQIQAFLDQRIGACENSNCLNVYRQTTRDMPVTERCTRGYQGEANERASRIIFKVQNSCNISAKVILVTLQKEQGLVTSRRPSSSTLERAMGYFCPDDPERPGWCHPDFAGFFNQVINASAQFQRYRLHPGSFNFRVGTFDVKYHPNSSCGTVPVKIRNAATAGLYNYTPYTPNPASLANLYRTGDSCSSYGNRNFWAYYTDWFGSPTGLSPGSTTITRYSGSDRYATGVALSAAFYPSGAPVVYVAVGSNFPDGLAAAPAAARAGGPLLLTLTDSVPASVEAEIRRLKPSQIVVVGSAAVVSERVYSRLAGLAPSIRRDAGSDRYQTAQKIASSSFPDGATTVFLAVGDNFPDALAVSAAAGALGGPVLLVPPGATSVDTLTRDLIRKLGATHLVAAGSSAVISTSYLHSVRDRTGVNSVTRLGGRDRFDTATLINEFAFPSAQRAFIANGMDFPDALSAAAIAGAIGVPLHLAPATCVPSAALRHMANARVTDVGLVGGPSVLSNRVRDLRSC